MCQKNGSVFKGLVMRVGGLQLNKKYLHTKICTWTLTKFQSKNVNECNWKQHKKTLTLDIENQEHLWGLNY